MLKGILRYGEVGVGGGAAFSIDHRSVDPVVAGSIPVALA